MKQIRILLAEDDYNLGGVLKSYLEIKGFFVGWATDGRVAFDEFLKNEYDFCILDVMLPEKDGFTLARDIRGVDKKIPILFLTAKAGQEDKIAGFASGADDYMIKPFSMEELLMRIQAIIRRVNEQALAGSTEPKTVYQIGGFKFDTIRQTLKSEHGEQKLTSKETELLKILCEHLNNVVDRSMALTRIWKDDSYYNARSMDVYVTKLRKYLKEDTTIALINVHGTGFKLVQYE